MKLEHFGLAGPWGTGRVVFSATGPELAQAVEECRAAAPELSKEDLLTEAVNRAILAGFPALYEQLVAQQGLIPLSDPDFGLLDVSEETGFRAGAEFFCLPPLELGRCTVLCGPSRPRPIRKLTLELEINRNYGDADRAADPAGKQELRAQAARKLYAQRCAQAEAVARQELLNQLGAEVKGELPKQLLAQNYFAEQRAFNLRLQANGVNFDQYLQVQGQTVEQFRTWLHQLAEQKLRSRLGLLLVAQQEGLVACGGGSGRSAVRLGPQDPGRKDLCGQRPAETAPPLGSRPGGCLCAGTLYPDPAAGTGRCWNRISEIKKVDATQKVSSTFFAAGFRRRYSSTPSNWLL